MAIGRISGQMLSSSLDRQSDLTFVNNSAILMQMDFTNSKVGINTDSITETLTVKGNFGTIDSDNNGIVLSGASISAKNASILTVLGQIDLGDLGNVYIEGGNKLDVITTDGTGILTWANISTLLADENFLQNVTINGSTISTNVTDGNLILRGNGAGMVKSNLMSVNNFTANTITSGNINGTFTGNAIGTFYGNLTGEVLTAAQPYITSLGTLSNLSVAGSINGTLHGDVYTDNIFGIDGNLTITTQPGTVLTINSTAGTVLPTGNTLQRPLNTTGAFRYNSDLGTPEYYNGSIWVTLTSQIRSQRITSGDGVTQTFNLTYPATTDGVIVSTNGVLQQPTVAYNVDSNLQTITFTEAPLSTDAVEVRFIASVSTLEENSSIVSTANTAVTTSLTTIDSFDATVYRAAKYTLSATATNGDVQMSEVFVTHNGSTSAMNQAVNFIVGSGAVITSYSTDWVSNRIELLAIAANPGAVIRMQKLYFLI